MTPTRRPRTRRQFLADVGGGFTGLVLGAMLFEDGIARAAAPPPIDNPVAKAKSVIWIFMLGGVSQLETFDNKPILRKYSGKSIAETPFASILKSPRLVKNFRPFTRMPHPETRILEPQIGFKKRGQSGIEVSDWLPHLGECVDDIAFVRSMWSTDFDHSAQSAFNTGRIILDGREPSIGAWAHYGLGTGNGKLPQFVVLGRPPSDFGGGLASHQASYLGPEYDGVPVDIDPKRAVLYPPFGPDQTRETQRSEFELIAELNRLSTVEYPSDPALRARIKSYELAFQMQDALPGIVNVENESKETRKLYGIDNPVSDPFGRQCLVARRLVERGVRFVQLYHGGAADDDNGLWDSHQELKKNHAARCAEVDRPVSGLLKDLKRRGLLDSTLVVWASEFGRSPNVEPRPEGESDLDDKRGRDHHIFGFTVWFAGGGVKGGMVHGATDELGFHAVEDRHYVTDVHATVLHQLGLDPAKLEIPGRKRLDTDLGAPITDILA
jgi:Protein of unknown function (DUF1501)